MTCGCESGLFAAMRRDIDRCFYSLYGDRRPPFTAGLRIAVLFPGLWVALLYRLCHYFSQRCKPRILGTALLALTYIPFRMLAILFGIEINPRAHIGAGVLINHFGGIHIGPVVMGENCNISHGVTIGRSSRVHGSEQDSVTEFFDTPTFGNRVWLGVGAIISGPVTLGADSVVAGNSLVTRDVPPRGVAMGVPAKIVSYKGSFKQVAYRGMESDPDRLAVLAEVRATEAAESSPSNN